MTAAAQPTAAESRRAGRPWKLIAAVGAAAFITGLDNTILNIALSAMQRDLGLSLTGLQWVGTSYILAFSSLLLVGGRLTDIFGRRRVIEVGLGVFIVGSMFAGVAPTEEWVIIARVVQGIGGALVLPATLAVIGTDLEGEDRHFGMGVWTASIASAIALGPIVGGAIISVAHWSWVFFINLPLGLLCIALVRGAVGGQRLELPARGALLTRLDIPGLISASIGLFGITFFLVEGQESGFGSVVALVSLGIGLGSAVLFVVSERRTEHPLVELALFRNRVFSGGTLAQIIWGLGINGILFFTSLFLQDVMELRPFQAGLMYVPLAIAVGVTVPLGAKMATALGVNTTVAIGMLLIAAGMLLGVFVEADDSPLEFLVALCIVGFGSGLTTPMTSAVLDVVPLHRSGSAAAVVSTAREISGVVGIVAIGAVLVVRRGAALDDGASTEAAFVSGFHAALIAATFVMLIGALISWRTLTTKAQAVEFAAAREAERAGLRDEPLEREGLEATTPADLGLALAETRDQHAGHAHRSD